MVQVRPVSGGGALGRVSQPSQTNSAQRGTLCSGQVPPKEAEVGQAAIKARLMPLTDEGLKVKEELSASLSDVKYLCLNGMLAFPPLGAEPTSSSSPHPYFATPGLSAGSHCP